MTLWVESRRAGRGDAAAFELLWERHRDATYRTVLRVLGGHRAMADDVLQDAWLEVARATAYQAGSFKGFMRTVVTRKALDRLATASVRLAAGAGPGDAEEEPLATLESDGPDPARGAAAREGAGLVLDVVERLQDAQRLAWTLHYVEGLTFEEVAGAMQTPLGTAKTRVRLANAVVAEQLSRRGVAVADLEEEA